ncbi:MAG: hypothetical protein A4E52_01239 [Pelotomaculum sp. PtaB.Bin013]|nr:MAG: hypothetical protein A4E52_01239 [Pelotomaculum sp. PtaB.Bin013]
MSSIFEVLMLVCFGAAWPASIYKSYVSRQTAGKSILFLWIVFAGYFFGVIHKLVFSYDLVIYLYILNGVMVMADIILYYRNKVNHSPEKD